MAKTKVRELILRYEDGSEANVTFGLPASDCESNGEWPSITEHDPMTNEPVTTDFSDYAQGFLLDAGVFHSYKGWDSHDTVHDPNCDCGPMVVERSVNKAKREILEDLSTGRFKADEITTFADLHDYVDANEYGGLCSDSPWTDEGGLETYSDEANEVQDRLDAWIKAGGLR